MSSNINLATTVYKILLKPLSTEKTNKMADKHNIISFRVATWANKAQIKQAIEQLFTVNVQQVNIINMAGKIKSFKQQKGKRSDWKKANIKLQPGQDIKIAEFIK